jgi:hypothetical protein
MGVFGTSNKNVFNAVQDTQQKNFKTVNNLLTLQDNHVEEFFQYHGEAFLGALEKLMEDVTERVVSQMLSKLEFVTNSASGTLTLQTDALRDYERITQENIDLDLQMILAAALNDEVIMQRKLAKQQYLESQGFAAGSSAAPQQMQQQMGQQMGQQPMGQQPMGQPIGGMANNTGYPVPPAGTDNYGNPYWVDQATGQMTYQPPSSGLHLGQGIAKAAAWAKWLA